MEAEEIERIKKILALAGEAEQSIVPDDLREKGWVYRDPPGRFAPEAWSKMMEIAGADEIQILTFSRGATKDGEPWVRGQILISPKGIENLKKDYEAECKAPN